MHPLNQLEAKVKSIMTGVLPFFQYLEQFSGCYLEFSRLILIFSFALIGHHDFFGFGHKPLKVLWLSITCI